MFFNFIITNNCTEKISVMILSNPGRGFSSPLSSDAKKPAFSCGLFSKYGGEGGIDSLRSPCGQLPRRLVSCPDAQAHLSNPGRGFSSPLNSDAKKPAFSCGLFSKYGGEGGIRTPDTLPYTHFPGVLLQPLGHLTILSSRCCAGRR